MPGFLIAPFIICAILNPILFIRREILKRSNAPSLIPIIGGILGAYGFSLCPYKPISNLAWLPLILDFGTIPWIMYCIIIVHIHKRPIQKDTKHSGKNNDPELKDRPNR